MQTPVESPSATSRSGAQERHLRGRSLQGQRAGFVSRLAADVVDGIVVVILQFLAYVMFAVIRYLLTKRFQMPRPETAVTLGVFWAIAVVYLTWGWATTGKSFGKQLVGIRVVRVDGTRLRSLKALLRALLYWLLPVGLAWSLFSRRNASVQDLALDTVVLYDWTYRTLEGAEP
ncbi:MAG TPA: RDD family protein [Actinomycetota bacterium]|nr:RDD family protein [Actinomycetota bacterium]